MLLFEAGFVISRIMNVRRVPAVIDLVTGILIIAGFWVAEEPLNSSQVILLLEIRVLPSSYLQPMLKELSVKDFPRALSKNV
jgi:hypothetical protein